MFSGKIYIGESRTVPRWSNLRLSNDKGAVSAT